MPGIGNYSRGKKFALKSGNRTSYKMMGSSAYKHDPENPIPPKKTTVKAKKTIKTSGSATAGK